MHKTTANKTCQKFILSDVKFFLVGCHFKVVTGILLPEKLFLKQ